MLLKRQQEILAEVSKRGTIPVNDLLKLIDSSPATIRRDLTFLEKNNFILRSHGYVHSIQEAEKILPVNKRSVVAALEKKKIASLAASFIKDGMTLILDSGTTCQEIARQILDRKVTVVTNSIEVCRILLNSEAKVISCGGMLMKEQQCFLGPDATAFLRNIEVDLCFLGATGVRSTTGLTTSSPLQLDYKKQAIKVSTRTLAVFDTSKFSSANLYLFASFEDLDGVITNKPLPGSREEEMLKIIDADGTPVHIAG